MEKILEYTLKKKEYQISNLESHFSKSVEEIEAYINNKESVAVVGLGFNYISNWYIWNFNYDFLADKEVALEKLALSTYFGLQSNNVQFLLGKKVERYKQAVLFNRAIKHLGQMLLLGWDELAKKYGSLLIKMLNGKQYSGWHPSYKHPWFMLELFYKWENRSLDYDNLNYPDNMGVYSEVLKEWDTQNPAILSGLVKKLVDFHLAQSDEDEYNDKTPDFPSADYFII